MLCLEKDGRGLKGFRSVPAISKECEGQKERKTRCSASPARGIVWEDPETGQRQVLDFGVPTPGLARACKSQGCWKFGQGLCGKSLLRFSSLAQSVPTCCSFRSARLISQLVLVRKHGIVASPECPLVPLAARNPGATSRRCEPTNVRWEPPVLFSQKNPEAFVSGYCVGQS